MLAGGSFDHGMGLSDAYLYDVGAGIWRPGPSLPETRTWGRAVQYQVRDPYYYTSTTVV